MGPFIYSLCALTSLACWLLLWRAYRVSRSRLLFWSALSFALFTLNNIVLVLDKLVFVEVDLRTWRLAAAFAAVCVLVYGLVRDEE